MDRKEELQRNAARPVVTESAGRPGVALLRREREPETESERKRERVFESEEASIRRISRT